jgi:molybdate transport repressor ModE-like protein
MDIAPLKTFVAVAREGSITRASERLHLSQPAVSAHIKALEDALGVTLFERTGRGMRLTAAGERLLTKAEETLAAHRELMNEAKRITGRLTGRLRLAASNSSEQAIGRLLAALSERYPALDLVLTHATSLDILAGIRNGSLDAGLYNEAGDPDPELTTIEVSRFDICIVAAPGRVPASRPPDWVALAELSWIYPTSSTCCGRAAERLFKRHAVHPKRIISVDSPDVTQALIAGGVGVGLLHADAAKEAELRGALEVVFVVETPVRVLFAHLASRAHDPTLMAAAMLVGAAW